MKLPLLLFLALAIPCFSAMSEVQSPDDDDSDETEAASPAPEPPDPAALLATAAVVRAVPPLADVKRARDGVDIAVQAPANGVAFVDLAPAGKDARVVHQRFPVIAGANHLHVRFPAGPGSWSVRVLTRDYGEANRVGSLGRGEEQFTNPEAITIGTGGRLYVADTGSDRIEVLSDRHTFLFEFGGFSAQAASSFSVNDAQKFDEPCALVQSINSDIYVVDRNNNRIVRIDRDGHLLSTFGGDAGLKLPRGITANSRGEVIVADTGNDRLVVFDRDGHMQREFGTFGWGPRQFKTPHAVTIDDENNMIVADTDNDRVQIFDNFGKLVGILKNGFTRPLAVRADSDGMIWVVDGKTRQVVRCTRDNRVLETFAAPRLPLEEPADLEITPEGHLYIVDRAASVLWRVECRSQSSEVHGLLPR